MDNPATRGFRPGAFGTKDGKLAIEWHRPGIARLGEPSTVTIVTTYDREIDRFNAFMRGRDTPQD